MNRLKFLPVLAALALAIGVAFSALPQAPVYATNDVTICHKPTPSQGTWTTITVSLNALPAHLAHGDSLGACPPPPATATPVPPVDLCANIPGNQATVPVGLIKVGPNCVPPLPTATPVPPTPVPPTPIPPTPVPPTPVPPTPVPPTPIPPTPVPPTPIPPTPVPPTTTTTGCEQFVGVFNNVSYNGAWANVVRVNNVVTSVVLNAGCAPLTFTTLECEFLSAGYQVANYFGQVGAGWYSVTRVNGAITQAVPAPNCGQQSICEYLSSGILNYGLYNLPNGYYGYNSYAGYFGAPVYQTTAGWYLVTRVNGVIMSAVTSSGCGPQPTAVPQVAATPQIILVPAPVIPAAPRPAIAPPRTGDGGLLAD